MTRCYECGKMNTEDIIFCNNCRIKLLTAPEVLGAAFQTEPEKLHVVKSLKPGL